MGLRVCGADGPHAVHGSLLRRDYGGAPAASHAPDASDHEGAAQHLCRTGAALLGLDRPGDALRLRAVLRRLGQTLRAPEMATAGLIAPLSSLHSGGGYLRARLVVLASMVGRRMNEWLRVWGIALAAVGGGPRLFITRGGAL